jgi:hypothetical protein
MPGLRNIMTNTSLLALAISIFMLGCQPKEDATLPLELVGVWKTAAPKYQDATLELTKELITFTSGEFQNFIDVNFIIKVERKPERNHVLYTIHYENIEKQRYKFAFYHYPSKGGVIRPKNQMDIEWRKVTPVPR